MARKILTIALALALVFAFGFVVSAQSNNEHDAYEASQLLSSTCTCPVGTCGDDCVCVATGVCICMNEEGRTPLRSFLGGLGWGTLGAWIAMAASIVIAFFVTR